MKLFFKKIIPRDYSVSTVTRWTFQGRIYWNGWIIYTSWKKRIRSLSLADRIFFENEYKGKYTFLPQNITNTEFE